MEFLGWPDDERTKALFAAALRVHATALLVELQAPGGDYPDTGSPAVYVCDDSACSEPLTNPRTLTARATEFLDGLSPR